MSDTPLMIVVVVAVAVLLLMFLRTRKSGAKVTLTPRRLAEKQAEEEEAAAPKESQWKLGDLGAGGKIHLSLPKGLEEDYAVVRRDRVIWPDEQIEYDLRLTGEDPNHDVRLYCWTVGVHTYAWLLEAEHYTVSDLGLSASLEQMRASGKGECTFKEQTYTLDTARGLTLYEGGMRPGRDIVRWDFRNDADTRQIVVQRNEREEGECQVLFGKELWLRDVTIIQPRAEGPSPSSAASPAGSAQALET